MRNAFRCCQGRRKAYRVQLLSPSRRTADPVMALHMRSGQAPPLGPYDPYALCRCRRCLAKGIGRRTPFTLGPGAPARTRRHGYQRDPIESSPGIVGHAPEDRGSPAVEFIGPYRQVLMMLPPCSEQFRNALAMGIVGFERRNAFDRIATAEGNQTTLGQETAKRSCKSNTPGREASTT